MIQIERLVRRIREALESGAVDAPLASLADELVTVVEHVNRRLDKCETVIAEGSEYQAIQMAEEAPNLLDAVATLSFPKAEEWTELCQTQRLPVPASLNESAVRKLNAIYSKGIDRSHPLYREYRNLVRKRDKRRAFEVVNAIVRLNPGDKDSQSERERLKLSVLREIDDELSRALAENDAGQVEALIDAMEAHAASADLEITANETLRKAKHQLFEWRAAAAQDKTHNLLSTLADEESAKNFAQTAQVIETVDELVSEFGFDLGGSEVDLLTKRKAQLRTHRDENTARAGFQTELGRLDTMILQLETLSVERESDVDRLRDTRARLEKQWMAIESHRRPVPDGLRERAERMAARMDSRIDQIESRRRRNLTLTIAATACAVLAACIAGYLFWSATQYDRSIAALLQDGRIDEAHALATEAAARPLRASVFPFLSSRVAETNREMERELDRRREVEAKIGTLTEVAQVGFSDESFPAVERRVEEMRAALQSTAQEFQRAMASRVTPIENAFALRMTDEQETFRGVVDAMLDSVIKSIENHADMDRHFDPRDTVRVESINAALAEIESTLSSSGSAHISPSEAQKVRIDRLRDTAGRFLAQTQAVAKSQSQLAESRTFDEFRSGLESLTTNPLVDPAEITAAARVLASVDSEDHFKQMLLLPNGAAVWSQMKDRTDIRPEEATKVELQMMLAIRDDPMLTNIHVTDVEDFDRGGARRKIFSRGGAPTQSSREGSGVKVESAGGEFYDPLRSPGTPIFSRQTYIFTDDGRGQKGLRIPKNSTTGMSPESTALLALRIEDIFNDDGTKYMRHLLTLVDRILGINDVSPVFKAYLLQQCLDVLAIRPGAWGLSFSPSTGQLTDSFRRLTADSRLRSSDWMSLQSGSAEWAKFKDFFDSQPSGGTANEVRINHGLFSKATQAGLYYAGFVDSDGTVRLSDARGNAYPLWAMHSETSVVRVTPDDTSAAMPLSPVFYVPIRPADTVRDVLAQSGPAQIENLQFVSPLFQLSSEGEFTSPAPAAE